MKATEAKNLADSHKDPPIDDYMKNIYRFVKEAAEKGNYSINILPSRVYTGINRPNDKQWSAIFKQLSKDGYQCPGFNHTHDYLTLCWSHSEV